MNRKIKAKGREKLPFLEQFRHLKKYLILAGIKSEPKKIFSILYIVAGAIDFGFLVFIIYNLRDFGMGFLIFASFLILTLGYLLTFMITWLVFLFMLDYFKFKRKTALEEVLPEFLRLVSANHRAGLPLDASLWKANRPRFGILAEEINDVAKNTYATGELAQPLIDFSKKYDSNMLKRVVSNLVEGIKTGTDLSSLLDDISSNITVIRNTRKELASEVENYMLFITVTVLVISPLMFGLTHKMSGLIETVKGTLSESFGEGGDAAANSPIPINFDKAAEGAKSIDYYFNTFVYLMILTNSTISVLLMSMVKYGNIKQELKRIPVYYLIAMSVYILSRTLFGGFLNFT